MHHSFFRYGRLRKTSFLEVVREFVRLHILELSDFPRAWKDAA